MGGIIREVLQAERTRDPVRLRGLARRHEFCDRGNEIQHKSVPVCNAEGWRGHEVLAACSPCVRGAQKLWDKIEREKPQRGEFEQRAIDRERAEYAATLKAPTPAKAYARLSDMDSEYTPNFWLYRTAEAGSSKTLSSGPHGFTPGLVLSKSIKKDWRDD